MYFNYLFEDVKWAEAASAADSFINNKNQFSGYCSSDFRYLGCSNYIQGFNSFFSLRWQRVLLCSILKSLLNYLWHYIIIFVTCQTESMSLCLPEAFLHLCYINLDGSIGQLRGLIYFLSFFIEKT